MAGRYLLIEFDDTKTADAMRARIDEASRKGKPYRVVGLFAIPGPSFCECDSGTNDRITHSPVKRGMKFGWWVCTACKKPLSVFRLNNLIGVDEVIRPRIYKIRHYLTKKPTEMLFHSYSIESHTRLAPEPE